MSPAGDISGSTTAADTTQHEKPDDQDDVAVVFPELDPEEEKKLVRKLDRHIMPLMAIVYFFHDLDKNSINFAAIFGLRADLSVYGKRFSWAVAFFYLGQLISEYPAAYILSRFRITRFVGVTIVVWGLMEMCMGASNNFGGLAATRFLLGFAEAAVSPAFIIITSNWYRRSEHPVRVATWISMNGISQIVGSLLMYALGRTDLAIPSWGAIFLVFGGLTIASGIAFLILMPVDTTTAWFLTEREREVATMRLAIDRATRDKADFDPKQMVEALKSPLTWLSFMMAVCITLTAPILKYSCIAIERFGFSKFRTMLISLPAGGLNFITVWISALVPHFFPRARILTAICLVAVPLAGSVLFLVLPEPTNDAPCWGVVSSTWLAGCTTAPFCSCAALLASNVKGNTKKSIVTAGFFMAFCVGSIAGSQAWLEREAPRYRTGCMLSIASWDVMVLVLLAYQTVLRSKNKNRDRKAAEGFTEYKTGGPVGGRSHIQIGVSENSDLTDVEDKGFRYST